MFDIFLLVSFVNLLALLPLFAGLRQAEFMGSTLPSNFWEHLISIPWLLCLGVIIAATYLAFRLSDVLQFDRRAKYVICLNSGLMLCVWVFPGLLAWSTALQQQLIEFWSVGAAVLLLLSSLYVPIKGLIKLLMIDKGENTPTRRPG